MRATFEKRWTAANPGNNEIAILFDTTRELVSPAPAAVAAGSAFLIPGPLRGKFPRGILNGFVRVTAQAVDLKCYRRTEYDGDANDWELEGDFGTAGVQNVPAGTSQPFEIRTDGEFLLRVDCGATAPTIFVAEITWTPTSDFGD